MNDTATTARWEIAGGVSLGALLKIFSNTTGTSDEEFDTALRTAAREFAAGCDVEWILALAGAAVALFNAAEIARAGRLFATADKARRELGGDAEVEERIQAGVSSALLDVSRFLKCVDDPRQHPHVVPILRFFADFRPQPLLELLEVAESERRRRFLVNAVALQGADAVVPLLNCLDWPEVQQHSARYLLDLLAILSSLDEIGPDSRRRAATLAGRYLVHEDATVRSAALAALERLDGREAVLAALGALKASAYPEAAAAQDLCPHLAAVLRFVAARADERAVALVAEVAIGENDGGFKLGHRLEEAAIDALLARPEPLPSRAVRVVVRRLEATAASPLRLMAGRFVQSSEVRRTAALMALVAGSPDAEIQSLLAASGLRGLAQSDRVA